MPNGLISIPEEITSDDFITTRNHLNAILTDLGASQVSMRLNESGEVDPGFSYFVGFVQNASARQRREAFGIPDPGLFRFGDDVRSKEYRDSVKLAKNPDPLVRIRTRDWSAVFSSHGPPDFSSPPPSDYRKKGMGSRNIDIHSGVFYRKYIGILVDGVTINGETGRRCVGMLGVGYPNEAAALTVPNLNDRIIAWAQGAPSTNAPGSLVKYLKDTFELGGPI